MKALGYTFDGLVLKPSLRTSYEFMKVISFTFDGLVLRLSVRPPYKGDTL